MTKQFRIQHKFKDNATQGKVTLSVANEGDTLFTNDHWNYFHNLGRIFAYDLQFVNGARKGEKLKFTCSINAQKKYYQSYAYIRQPILFSNNTRLMVADIHIGGQRVV